MEYFIHQCCNQIYKDIEDLKNSKCFIEGDYFQKHSL